MYKEHSSIRGGRLCMGRTPEIGRRFMSRYHTAIIGHKYKSTSRQRSLNLL